MDPRLETAYYRSPLWLQHAAVSWMGYGLHRERRGPEARTQLALLLESQRWSEDRMTAYVSDRLRGLLAHAIAHVPHYRRIAADLGVTAQDVSSVGQLTSWPILEKTHVRQLGEDLVVDVAQRPTALTTLHTSGTTGSPLTVWCDYGSRRRHYAFWDRLRSWFGLTPEMHRATFFGRVVCAPSQTAGPFYRYDYFQRNYLFSSYHLSERFLADYCRDLRRLGAEELCGYPSSLYALATYMLDHGIEGVRPRVVFTTAETLSPHQRRALTEAFGCPVVDQYGCTEMAMFVSQCERGAYHVHPEHGVVEIVDERGQPVPPGVPGEAVCTGFVNLTMPLIRYRLGDRMTMTGTACACGRPFPVVAEILGRTDDVLMTPSGRPLGRLDPVFKPLRGIRATQIVQTHPARLLLNIVTDGEFAEADREALVRELRKRTGDEMEIALEVVPDIPRQSSGKFRAVVSLVAHQRASGAASPAPSAGQ